ncbi:MAG: hypothetical protein KTR31_17435 [Myxococcales bacterium]|nr:hypothetical protein [Myxococcales bacterium]
MEERSEASLLHALAAARDAVARSPTASGAADLLHQLAQEALPRSRAPVGLTDGPSPPLLEGILRATRALRLPDVDALLTERQRACRNAMAIEAAAVQAVARGFGPAARDGALELDPYAIPVELHRAPAPFRREHPTASVAEWVKGWMTQVGPPPEGRRARALRDAAERLALHWLRLPLVGDRHALASLRAEVRRQYSGDPVVVRSTHGDHSFVGACARGGAAARAWLLQHRHVDTGPLTVELRLTGLRDTDSLSESSGAVAAALAVLSRFLDVRPPPVVVTGDLDPSRVDASGRWLLIPVDDVEHKRQLAEDYGVRRFVAPQGQTFDDVVRAVFGELANRAAPPAHSPRWPRSRRVALQLPHPMQPSEGVWCPVHLRPDAEVAPVLHRAILRGAQRHLRPTPVPAADLWSTLEQWRQLAWGDAAPPLRILVGVQRHEDLRDIVASVRRTSVPRGLQLGVAATSWGRGPTSRPMRWALWGIPSVEVMATIVLAATIVSIVAGWALVRRPRLHVDPDTFASHLVDYLKPPRLGNIPGAPKEARAYVREKVQDLLRRGQHEDAAQLLLVFAEITERFEFQSDPLRSRVRALEIAQSPSTRRSATTAILHNLASLQHWSALEAMLEDPDISLDTDARTTWHARARFGQGDPRHADRLGGSLGTALAPYASGRTTSLNPFWVAPADQGGSLGLFRDFTRPGTRHTIWRDDAGAETAGPLFPGHVAVGVRGGRERFVTGRLADAEGLRQATIQQPHTVEGRLQFDVVSEAFEIGDLYDAMQLPDGTVLVATGNKRRGIVTLRPDETGFLRTTPPLWPQLQGVSDIVRLQSIDDQTVLVGLGPWDSPGVAWARLDGTLHIEPVPHVRAVAMSRHAPHQQAWALVHPDATTCLTPTLEDFGMFRVVRGEPHERIAAIPCPPRRLGGSRFGLGQLWDISRGGQTILVAELMAPAPRDSAVWFLAEQPDGSFDDIVLWHYDVRAVTDEDRDGVPELVLYDQRLRDTHVVLGSEGSVRPGTTWSQNVALHVDESIPEWRVVQRLARWGLRYDAEMEMLAEDLGPPSAVRRVQEQLRGISDDGWTDVDPRDVRRIDPWSRWTGTRHQPVEVLGGGHVVAWIPVRLTGPAVGVRFALEPWLHRAADGRTIVDDTRADWGSGLSIGLYLRDQYTRHGRLIGASLSGLGALPDELSAQVDCDRPVYRGVLGNRVALPPSMRSTQPWFDRIELTVAADLRGGRVTCIRADGEQIPIWTQTPLRPPSWLDTPSVLEDLQAGTEMMLVVSSGPDGAGFRGMMWRSLLVDLAIQGLQIDHDATLSPHVLEPPQWPADAEAARALDDGSFDWARPDRTHPLFLTIAPTRAAAPHGSRALSLLADAYGADAALEAASYNLRLLVAHEGRRGEGCALMGGALNRRGLPADTQPALRGLLLYTVYCTEGGGRGDQLEAWLRAAERLGTDGLDELVGLAQLHLCAELTAQGHTGRRLVELHEQARQRMSDRAWTRETEGVRCP